MAQTGKITIGELAAGYAALPPAPPAGARRAIWSDLLVDSIGVTIHPDAPAYSNQARVIGLLTEMGVRHTRFRQYGPGTQGAAQVSLLTALKAAGIQAMGPIGAVPRTGPLPAPTDAGSPEQIVKYLALNAPQGSLSMLEGCNEPNIQGNLTIDAATGLPQWALDARAHQARLYAAAKGATTAATWGSQAAADTYNAQIPAWVKALPVTSPALGAKRGFVELGSMTGVCDILSHHLYQQGTIPSKLLNSQIVQLHTTIAPTKQVVFTETGYHTALAVTDGSFPISPAATGLYDPRRVVRFFARSPAAGNSTGVARAYRYQLIDEGTSQIDKQQAYGVVAFDGTNRKPGFTGMKNLIALAADPGDPYVPDLSTGALAFQIVGGPADLAPPILLQRRDGTFLIVLEREVEIWDRTNRKDIVVPDVRFTVSFGSLVSGSIYRPSLGANPVATFTGSTVDVAAGGGLVVLAVGTSAPAAPTLLSPFYGGGGQSAFAWDPTDTSKGITGSDTGGPRRFSEDTRTSTIELRGLNGLGAKQADGVVFSTAVTDTIFMQCGRVPTNGVPDGTGGLYVSANGLPWDRLDGILAGKPKLNYNGGNVDNTYTPGGPVLKAGSQYPRHYADGTLLQDGTSISGSTLILTSTVRDGAWRFKRRNSDGAVLEQEQVPGTEGTYLRSMAYLGSKSRVLISTYDGTNPTRPRLCTNANAAAGTALTTSPMTSTPPNVEQASYVAAPGAGTVPLTVIATGSASALNASGFKGDVLISTNAHTAAAGSISWVSLAKPAGAQAPETDEWWHVAATTYESNGAGGYNHVILVAAVDGGRRNGSTFNSVWRGVIPATAATTDAAAAAVVWTVPTFTEQVLGVPGAANKWWNAGVNTPTLSGTSTVSAFSVHPLDPKLVAATAKGNTFRSTDGGKTFHPSAIAGSSEHNAAWFDVFSDDPTRANRFMTTTGDWPLAAAVDLPPAHTFDSQGNAVLRVTTAAAQGGTTDPRTGDVFLQVKTAGGGHSVPSSDPNLAIISYTGPAMANTFTDLVGSTDWGLTKDTGTSASAVMGMEVAYGTSTSSGGNLIIARQLGKGMWWRTLTNPAWTKIAATTGSAPFSTSPPGSIEQCSHVQDETRGATFWLDRTTGQVWRVSLSATGAVQPAVRLFQRSWSYTVAGDGVGNLSIDRARGRLWLSTKDGILWLDNAATATNVAGTTDTDGAFQAVPWQTYYPGEIPGPMQYSTKLDAVFVHTEHYATPSTPVYNPLLNGADGPRSLVVANPTVGASWSPAVADDRSQSRDPGLRSGIVYPKGSSINRAGDIITLQQQGSGLFVMRLT